MTSRQETSDKQALISVALTRLGWKFGTKAEYLFKTSKIRRKGTRFWERREMRITMMANSCRLDILVPTTVSRRKPLWVRIGGGYWKDCAVLNDGRVKLGGFMLGQQEQGQSI